MLYIETRLHERRLRGAVGRDEGVFCALASRKKNWKVNRDERLANWSVVDQAGKELGDIMPFCAVLGRCNMASTFAAFTQAGPLSTGASLLVYQTRSLATLLVNPTESCLSVIDLSTFLNFAPDSPPAP